MGSFSSKLHKSNSKNSVEEKNKSKERIQILDPRSPTGEIARTPITVEKKISESSSYDGDPDCGSSPSLLKKRLLKNLKLDPRSPSDGIYRTPIFLEHMKHHPSKHTSNPFESPLSIYSHNLSALESFSEIKTPNEPSVNVSGFYKNDLSKSSEMDSSFSSINLDDNEKVNSCCDKKDLEKISHPITHLKVSNKPSTLEAKKLLNEILSSKEFDGEFDFDVKPSFKKSINSRSLSVHCDESEHKLKKTKRDTLKLRTPLSNITMSTNSPNNLSSIRKPYARCKIMADVGRENTVTSKLQIAEWDKDKTIII